MDNTNNPVGWVPPADLDSECVKLCVALNKLPGIKTTGSCCGHYREPYRIWVMVTDYYAMGLTALSRFLSRNYYTYGQEYFVLDGLDMRRDTYWKLVLCHRDVHPQVIFLLEGPRGAFEEADRLAELIERHVSGNEKGYNILKDDQIAKELRDEGFWEKVRGNDFGIGEER